jgi:hypothetical protein
LISAVTFTVRTFPSSVPLQAHPFAPDRRVQLFVPDLAIEIVSEQRIRRDMPEM